MENDETKNEAGSPAGAGAGAAGGGAGAGAAGPEPVPHSRFAEVVGQRNKAREDLAALKAAAVETGAGHAAAVSALEVQLATAAEGQAASASDLESARRHLMLSRDHGINGADTVAFLDFTYGNVKPAEGEAAPTFVDWLEGYKATDPVVLRASANGKAAKPPKNNKGADEVPATEPAVNIGRLTTEQYRAQRLVLLKENKVGSGRS